MLFSFQQIILTSLSCLTIGTWEPYRWNWCFLSSSPKSYDYLFCLCFLPAQKSKALQLCTVGSQKKVNSCSSRALWTQGYLLCTEGEVWTTGRNKRHLTALLTCTREEKVDFLVSTCLIHPPPTMLIADTDPVMCPRISLKIYCQSN